LNEEQLKCHLKKAEPANMIGNVDNQTNTSRI
jgi:hypothetical protein